MNFPGKPNLRLFLMVAGAAATVLFANVVTQAASYSSVVLADSPAAYYRLEEAAGADTAVDASANHFDAPVIYNVDENAQPDYPRFELPGIEANSALFRFYRDSGGAAHHGYVKIPFQSALAPTTDDGQHGAAFSVECWAQPLTQPADYSVPLAMFGQYETGIYGNASGWNFYQSPGPASFWIFNAKNGPFAQAGSVLIEPLKWYHLAATFDGSTFVFYVNGVAQVTAGGVTTYLADHNASGQIGAGDNTGFLPFTGGVDEVAFYTTTLSAAQVLNHYQSGSAAFSTRAFPPFILEDPASLSVTAGNTAKFTVIADGATPLTYQWLRNGQPINGATGNPYSFVTVEGDNGAKISVKVSNGTTDATSAEANLSVQGTLSIDHSPFSITREDGAGSSAAFRVVASGSVPITYQWYKVSQGATNPVSGQTSDTLWLTGLQVSDSDSEYFARVHNAFATLDSDHAVLTVVARAATPTLTIHGKIVVADHPVAYWPLDEADGSATATDAVGSFDGSYTPAANATTPVYAFQVPGALTNDPGKAVKISGGAVISIPYALELNPVTGPWSFEAWIKPSSLDSVNFRTPFSSLFNSDFGNHIFGWNIYQHPEGYWTFNAFNGGGGGSFTSEFNDHPLDVTKWYHMVITDDLTTLKFYVNGVVGATVDRQGFGFKPNGINGDRTVAGAPIVLGQRSDNAFDPFAGSIDEAAAYNYALTPTQINNHFLNTVTLTIVKTTNGVSLTWPVGTLQSSTTVNGTYTDVDAATSPYPNAAGGTQAYYRVVVR